MKLYLLSIIMATLADLFVSYKSVVPKKEIEQQPEIGHLWDLETAQNRLQQIEDNNSITNDGDSEAPEAGDDIDVNFDWMDNENENDDEFKWYVADVYKPSIEYGVPTTDAAVMNFTPKGTVTKYNRGHLDTEIQDLFKKHGINITVTSGKRAAGAAGKAGKKSHHVQGNAADIVPGKGETFDSIKRKILQNPEILQFFYENGLGVIDETDPDTIAKTGASGKHFHIGPDKLALQTWSKWLNTPISKIDTTSSLPVTGNEAAQKEWTQNMYNAYVKGLKEKYKNRFSNNTYNRLAAYMTYQAAIESAYGQKTHGFNYGGHMKNGKPVTYSSMDQFVNAQLQTLSKWDVMNANSLREYVDSLYSGPYKYNPSESPDQYYSKINGTVNRVNSYLGLSFMFGGKFTNVRQYYAKNLS